VGSIEKSDKAIIILQRNWSVVSSREVTQVELDPDVDAIVALHLRIYVHPDGLS
jgi:hypothetical protein